MQQYPKLIDCPTCKKDIASNASKCPHCGTPFLAKSPAFWLIVILIGLAACIFAVWLASVQVEADLQRSRDYIDDLNSQY